MASYRLTPRAQQDLSEIWHHIAADNEAAADRFITRLFDKFELAAIHPEIGPSRPELSETARLLIEGRYLAIYEPAPYGVLIITIVHGMRDPTQWLSET